MIITPVFPVSDLNMSGGPAFFSEAGNEKRESGLAHRFGRFGPGIHCRAERLNLDRGGEMRTGTGGNFSLLLFLNEDK
ncbi:MAG: hypothetical protein CSB33_03585 [Desulfobacterales bacterium]|nr:MAG: hypothetical protein CSB33_03585 [Desulfobacterales bacterium]